MTSYGFEKFTPFSRFETTLFSEPVPLSSVSNSWKSGSFKGGKQQFGDIWIETGVKKGNWGLSTLYRQRQQYDFSHDTADLYNILENTHNLETGKTYTIDLQAQRFTASGLRGTYSFQPIDTLSLQIGASLFQASNFMNGGMKGTATALSNNDYDYQVNIDYAYSEDILFDRPNVNAPKGQGYSLDLQLNWQPTKKIDVSLNAKDVLAAIYWNDVPHTDALITSNIKTVGDDGFIKIQPNLAGKEDYQDTFKQKVTSYGDAQIRYSLNNAKQALLTNAKFFGDNVYMGIGGETKVKNASIAASYYPELDTLSLKYKHKKIAFKLAIDSLKLKEANNIWLGIEFN